ncbi:hypothetical protein LIER_13247 [Lithospermum erythrorhizon]|uniref:J domain-containing protein n=1 Tax=Lithospermum erythrorhizon TaxID=34254 RepID=A0AAV3PWA4_LITER
MDGNKDEALKCLQIGKSAIESGDSNRAEKFLNKARRLDPSIEIDDLLSKIHEPIKKSTDSVNGPRKRASLTPSSSKSTRVAYSEEQEGVVREIKRKKDYYEILGVEKGCSVEDVKKGYRKLSLKVHPDKNPAPGAEEAFKKVSKAFQCLSDEGSRRRYDVSGADEDVVERGGGRGGGMHGFNGFNAEEFDADEIFRNFFFGGMNNGATTQFRGFGFGPGMGARGGDHGSQGFRLIQLLPVLIILLLNFMPSSQPIYSLSNSYPYEYRFTTQKGVNYYVRERDFEQKYPDNSSERVSLENRVENDYYSILSHNCRVEMQQFNWGYRRETPNCDEMRRLQSLAY